MRLLGKGQRSSALWFLEEVCWRKETAGRLVSMSASFVTAICVTCLFQWTAADVNYTHSSWTQLEHKKDEEPALVFEVFGGWEVIWCRGKAFHVICHTESFRSHVSRQSN